MDLNVNEQPDGTEKIDFSPTFRPNDLAVLVSFDDLIASDTNGGSAVTARPDVTAKLDFSPTYRPNDPAVLPYR